MYQQVLRFAPGNWDISSNQLENYVNQSTEEYNQVAFEIKQAIRNVSVRNLIRVQNVHDLGQFLVREQFLATTIQNTHNYYRVRKYMVLHKDHLKNALTYNLDPRRCGLDELTFHTHITRFNHDDVLIVVQVVTKYPDSNTIKPELSTEYYIEYVAQLTRRL